MTAYHPDDIKAVCDANRPRLLATIEAIRPAIPQTPTKDQTNGKR